MGSIWSYMSAGFGVLLSYQPVLLKFQPYLSKTDLDDLKSHKGRSSLDRHSDNIQCSRRRYLKCVITEHEILLEQREQYYP